MSLIIRDGTGSLNEVCRWSQDYRNINYAVELLKKTINFVPEIKDCSGSKNCKTILIPRFLIKIAIKALKIKNIKSYEFFERVCGLPREYQFQVFTQLVVDEGSPDRNFIISQSTKDVQKGILLLARQLGYRCTVTKTNHIYFHTENFPKIKKDYERAKEKFGKYGGFWFKDSRFEKACKQVNPEFSKHTRLFNEEFDKSLNILKKKEIFMYRDLKNLVKMPESCLWTRIRRSIKCKRIIRINRNYYTFPKFLDREDVKWLFLTKEEKLLNSISEFDTMTYKEILTRSPLVRTQTFRALQNLLKEGKIKKLSRGLYSIARNAS